MVSDSTHLSDEQFLKIAVHHRLLTADEADRAGRAAAEVDTSLSALCIEKGVLRPVQVDVIHGLAEQQLAPGYEVVGLLGYGGLGIVYRARQPKLDRLVALKTIPLQRIENPSVIARFQQEAKAIGRLKHPNIVPAYDYGTHRDRLYLAMELVEGIDLDVLINRRGQLSEQLAWALARQAAAGLAHAEQHNLVHRDIKPGNLLITKTPEGYPLPPGVPLLKITDFGLVQLEQPESGDTRLTLGGTSLGTPHYMAPEQVADTHVDIRADIYALGATVFHMIAGQPPFHGKNVGQVLAAKIKANQNWREKLPQGTSQATVDLLTEMLAQKPENRVPDYPTLLSRIEEVASGQTATIAVSDQETIAELLQTDSSLDLLLDLTPTKISNRERKRFKFAALAFGLLIMAGFFVYHAWQGPPAIPTSQLMPSGWERPLFNGQHLTDWTTTGGSWFPTVDDMGGRVMTGRNGSIIRELPLQKESSALPTEHFGVRFKFDLKSAAAVELHFEHENLAEDQQSRAVLQMTKAGVTLGSKVAKKSNFLPDTACFPFAGEAEEVHYHELKLVRQEHHWLVQLDNKDICFKPIDHSRPTTAIEFYVEGGQAYIADVFVYELLPESPKLVAGN